MQMSLALLLLIHCPEPLFNPTNLAARLGYTKQIYEPKALESEGNYGFSRPTDGTEAQLIFSSSDTLKETFTEYLGPGGGDTTPLSIYERETWSGIPMGSDFRVLYRGPETRAKATGRYEVADVSLFLPLKQHGDSYAPTFGRDVPDRFREELEYLTRTLLANLVARRLTQPDTFTIGSQSCPTYVETKSSKRVISIKEWATGRGYALRWNEDTNVIALTKGDQMIIVPLGSRKIKVASQWRDTGEIIALKEGKVFVRLDAVEPG